MLYFNKIISVEDYLKSIDAVTAEDLIKTANEILNEEKLIKVILKSNNNKMPEAA
jgi:predicted Zn-dependent peptidase